MAGLAAVTLLGLLLALGLMRAGRGLRQRRGLGQGRTVSLDRLTLTSRRHGLTGRPDRILRQGGVIIPEEWKSARQLQARHVIQIGVYFLLIEEHFQVKPPHGHLVTGDGRRHRIENSEALRTQVLTMADEIRLRRAALDEPILVSPQAWQCRPCSMRGHCGQARTDEPIARR